MTTASVTVLAPRCSAGVTMTVTLIDATGARSELSGSTHGAAGETEVVTSRQDRIPTVRSTR